jgi:hypothetical protein
MNGDATIPPAAGPGETASTVPTGQGETAGAALPTGVSQAAQVGMWELLAFDSQVLAVHAALFHNDKVLFFRGSGNDVTQFQHHDFRSVLWDYQQGGTFQSLPTSTDVFCAGQATAPDGRLLVAGGTATYDPFKGLKTAYAFDPSLPQWTRISDMHGGRWYPSLVVLGNGTVLAFSGSSETGPNNRTPEIHTVPIGWQLLPTSSHNWPNFPHIFLLRSGHLFFTGGHMGGGAFDPVVFDPVANRESPVPGLSNPDRKDQSFSVLLPPAQRQLFMVMGGGGGAPEVAVDTVDIADQSVPGPHFTRAPHMHHARMHLNAVILPDRTVFVSGGGGGGEKGAVLESEIYHPDTNSWTVGATATVPRLYHSVALLLPDGRVITAGSNTKRGTDELRLEFYHPPYLFKGPRPVVASAPAQLSHGQSFELGVPGASDIKWAQLIRPMAITHSCDPGQRLVDLPFSRLDAGRLTVNVPHEPNIAPPGWYMLSVTTQHDIPSVAKWVHLG